MACDCDALAAAIVVDQTAVVVAEAGLTVAQQTLSTAQLKLWYDQYNFYLCGCGGEGLQGLTEEEQASRKAAFAANVEAIKARTATEIASMDESVYRLHRLVMTQIEAAT